MEFEKNLEEQHWRFLRNLNKFPLNLIFWDNSNMINEKININRFEDMFENIVSPDNESNYKNEDENIKWDRLCRYLRENNYCLYYDGNIIFDFSEQKMGLYSFAYNQIRNWVKKYIYNGEYSDKVEWKDRRAFISKLKLETKVNVTPPNELLEIFNSISFDTKHENINSNLLGIANAIEFLLKEGNKFMSLNFNETESKFIDNNKIKELRKKLQCFRHATQEMIKEREEMTDDERKFYLYLGYAYLTIIKKHLNENIGSNIPE